MTTSGATAKRTITQDFGQRAESERVSAERWNWITVLSAVGSASWLVVFVLTHANIAETSWSTVVYKLGVTIALAGLATYAGSQAAEHRREERDTKRIQLVLNALDPFLVSLDIPEGNELKLKIAKQAFAARPVPPRNRWKFGKSDISDALDILEQAKGIIIGKSGGDKP